MTQEELTELYERYVTAAEQRNGIMRSFLLWAIPMLFVIMISILVISIKLTHA